MGILDRFGDIMSANINSILDKMEDPAKMSDQYILNLSSNLAEVKADTAKVMAEEKRIKRLVDENKENVSKYLAYATKAVAAGNDADAMKFLMDKNMYEAKQADLDKALEMAADNTKKIRQMYDKLNKDLSEYTSRVNLIKAKAAVAKSQERVSKFSSSKTGQSAVNALDRLENKVDSRLDAATAMAELDSVPENDSDALMAKYDSSGLGVQEELQAMKAKLAQNLE